MKPGLLTDFSLDRKNLKINVKREFAAPLEKVWQAWTVKDILDQWWAPEPWKAKTKLMDFREGGQWLYAMVGPNNETHWSMAEFTSIIPCKSYSGLDAFCDRDGIINPDFPRSRWHNQFASAVDHTIVSIEIAYDDLASLDATIEMGFKEGFSAGLKNLDNWLANN